MTCPHIAWAFERGRELELSPSYRLTLIALCERAGAHSLECWPSLPCIAKDTGFSERTSHSAVHGLKALGLITMKLTGRVMHYFINRPLEPVSCMSPPKPSPLQPVHDSWLEAPLQSAQDSPAPLQPVQDASLQSVQGSDPNPCNSSDPILATAASKPLKREPLKEEDVSLRSTVQQRIGRTKPSLDAARVLPTDWKPSASLQQRALDLGISPQTSTADFVAYWTLGAGRDRRRNMKGWDQTYLNRLKVLAERGDCLIDQPKTVPRAAPAPYRQTQQERTWEAVKRVARAYA